MGNMSRGQQPTRMKMSSLGQLLDFNEQRGNPHTTGQSAAGLKTLLYTGTAKELPLYTQVKGCEEPESLTWLKFVFQGQ